VTVAPEIVYSPCAAPLDTSVCGALLLATNGSPVKVKGIVKSLFVPFFVPTKVACLKFATLLPYIPRNQRVSR